MDNQINSQPTPGPKKEEVVQPQVAAQPAKSNSCLIIVIIVLVIGFFTACILGWLGWKYFLSRKIIPKMNVLPTSLLTPTVLSPTPVPTLIVPSVSPTTTIQITPTLAVNSGYILPDSNSREISEAELLSLTPWQLKVARNEIYARYGRSFVHQDLACYFATKTWYVKNPAFSASQLTVLENKNVATILLYEQKINSPVMNVDSGCR
jgi:hypothetical protein